MTATNHDGHLRNRQIPGKFTVIPSSENIFVAVMVVAVMAIVCEPRERDKVLLSITHCYRY